MSPDMETTSIIMQRADLEACDRETKRSEQLRKRLKELKAKRTSRGLRRDTEAVKKLLEAA